MQTTSALWKTLFASGSGWVETVANIAGTDYTEISDPIINRAVMQNGLSIGNAVSATCEFTVRTSDVIPKSAAVLIKMRLTNGTQTSEWINAGTFYISHRRKDPVTGLLTLECYDALLKANAQMPALLPWTTGTGEIMTTGTGAEIDFSSAYPRSMSTLAADIALVMGVEFDTRTTLQTGSAYVIDDIDAGTTIHDVLCKIAAANGGNWIMTPDNKLRLVPIVSASNAASATANVVDVVGIIGGLDVSSASTITGIRYAVDNEQYIAGTDTGLVLDADVSATVASSLIQALGGKTYQSYTAQSAVYDPAAEIGDYVRAGANGEIRSVLCSETVTIGAAYRGNISAPESGEMSDEYPYVGGLQTTLGAAKSYAKSYANQVTDELDQSLDQQEVFNRLTNNGAPQGLSLQNGRVYLNADYINAGTMAANYIYGGTLTLGGSNNANGVLYIKDGSGDIVGIWDNSGITINGGVFGVDSDGKMTATNANIFGSISSVDTSMNSEILIADGEIKFGGYSTQIYTASIYSTFTLGTPSYQNLELQCDCIELNGAVSSIVVEGPGQGAGVAIWSSYATYNFCDFHVHGDFTATGTKSRVVSTDQYSERLLYCYETPSPMFGDVGEGVISDDGMCYVALDAVFAQTISTTQYQVFLQKYGDGDCYIAERKGAYFIVRGTPGLAFGWEIKAKQKDYDQRRLDNADGAYTPHTTDYGAEAAQYITNLQRGRIAA